MKKLSTIIENILENDKALLNYMCRGLVNLSAYSALIQEEVEKEFGAPVQTSAIIMAMRRKTNELCSLNKTHKNLKIPYNVVMTSGIISVNIKSSGAETRNSITRYSRLVGNTDEFFSITETGKEVSIITSEKNKSLCTEIFKDDTIISFIENLACIVVTFERDFVETAGILYSAFKNLFYENINIYEVYSTHNKTTFVVQEAEITKAYNALKNFI